MQFYNINSNPTNPGSDGDGDILYHCILSHGSPGCLVGAGGDEDLDWGCMGDYKSVPTRPPLTHFCTFMT
jgi:hypothetical protein